MDFGSVWRWAPIFVAALAVATATGPTLALQPAPAAPAAPAIPNVASIASADVDALIATVVDDATGDGRTLGIRRLATLRGGQAARAVELVAALPEPMQRTLHPLLIEALSRKATPDVAWVPILAGGLRSTSEAVRLQAASALASGGTDDAFAALADAAAAGNAVVIQRAATTGLSRVPRPESVAVLAAMLGEAHMPEAQLAATDALASLTGVMLPAGGRDGWRTWTRAALAADPATLEAQLVAAAATRAAAGTAQLAAAEAAIERFARTRYTDANAAARRGVILEYLRDRDAPVRLAGLRILLENVGLGELPDEPALALVRAGIVDSDPRVRRLAARVIRDGGDRPGARLALELLPRDTDTPTRLAVLQAVAPLADAADVGLLLEVVRADPSPDIRLVAASAAARVAASAGNRATTSRVSQALRTAIESADGTSRDSLLEALAGVPDADLGRFWAARLGQLGPRGAAGPTGTALRGLRTAGDRQTVDVAASFLQHPAVEVRVAAVQAVAATGGLPRLGGLQSLFDPRGDTPPPELYQAAREAFLTLMRAAGDPELAAWPDRLDDPQLRHAVLEELIRRARAGGAPPDRLSYRLHEAADLLAGPLGRPSDAASLYAESLLLELDRQEAASPGPATQLQPTRLAVARLEGAVVQHLLAGNVAAVSELSGNVLRRRPSLARDMGASVRRAADRLVATGRTADARDAVRGALAWDPPLDEVSRRNLGELVVRLAE